MKRIKIFLASSIDDLREDRIMIGDFFLQLNEIYLDSGIHFSLIKCENYDKSMASGGKQQEYDREIRESELVFFLFFRTVGDYTKHEFEVALDAFRNQQKPKIVTYFKYISSIEEVAQEVRNFMQLLDQEAKHYYHTYGHIDTLKLGILMQIKLMKLDNAQVKLEDGAVLLNGHQIVMAENVPLLRGNQTLQQLTEQRRRRLAELDRCRADYLSDSTPEKEAAFFAASAELNRVSEQLTAVEKETMELMTTVAEMTSDGRVLTHRQKEALKHFNQGDYAAVYAILKDEERENERKRAEARAEASKQELQGYVEEELLLIQTEKAQGLTKERVQCILASYQKVAELTQTHDLNKDVLYDYANFLDDQNQQTEAIAVAQKLQWYYSNPSITVADDKKAALYILLGNLYGKTQHYKEAERAYCTASEVFTGLAARNPDIFEPDLAINYNNLGTLYRDTQRYEDAEQALCKALEIYTRLAARNPDAFEPDLATSCNNLGLIYHDTQRYDDAEQAYCKALDIYAKLAARNPDAFEPDLAMSCNNLGALYHDTQRYVEVEQALCKALEIRKRLAARNPDAYEPVLAGSYNNLGALYRATQRHKDAERAHCKALEIRTQLAARNPDAFEPDLADSYNSLGLIYHDTQRHEDAERAYCKALEIRTRLAARNPGAFEPDLADSYNNLGVLYCDTQRYEDAEQAYCKALEIRTRLAVRNPDAYEPVLAGSYNNLGALYHDTQRYEDAEQAYCKALEIRKRLAARNPDAFEPYLAQVLWNMAALYIQLQVKEKLQQVLIQAQPLFEKLAQRHPSLYADDAALIRKLLKHL